MPFFIERNDITKVKCDAIVNAANSSLLGGGGVDGAIHYAAGPELVKECATLGGCRTGEAKITKGYKLPAKYVIHTVGPIWHGGENNEEELLRSCYRNSLALAEKNGCESVAFPLISSGVYGYPKDAALKVATSEIRAFLENSEMTVKLIIFGSEVFSYSGKYANEIKEYIDDNYAEAKEKQFDRSVILESNQFFPSKASKKPIDVPKWYNKAPDLSDKAEESQIDGCFGIPFEADYCSVPSGALSDEEYQLDESYFEMIIRLIDEKGMSDAQCYKRANFDRKYFNKMKNSSTYKPQKPVVIAFAVALELNIKETEELLEKAGFALSKSIKFDLICRAFIENGIYDIYEINEALFANDMPLLGNVAN